MLIQLDTWRKHNKTNTELAERIGAVNAIGRACDMIEQCRLEKQAKGDGSAGYWQALFDLNAKLLEELRRLK